jgi:Predicted membrane protein (DUF2079)
VLESTLGSGIFRTIQPHLFLPLVGWRWALGAVPIITLYGASANEQVRAFGIYYAIVLVPFLVIAASTGAMKVARRLLSDPGRAERAASVAVLLGALLVGSGHRGYSLRPWKAEVAAVPEAVAALAGEQTVLVQSGLFPHAGYDERFELSAPGSSPHATWGPTPPRPSTSIGWASSRPRARCPAASSRCGSPSRRCCGSTASRPGESGDSSRPRFRPLTGPRRAAPPPWGRVARVRPALPQCLRAERSPSGHLADGRLDRGTEVVG